MNLFKIIKDHITKILRGNNVVPRELLELSDYFRHNSNIHFDYKKENDTIVAISTNFRYGSIVTSGKNQKELDKNIRDAILTSFDVPSAYAAEAQIHRVGEKQANEYVLA